MALVVVDGQAEQAGDIEDGRTSRGSRSAPSRHRPAPGRWRPSVARAWRTRPGSVVEGRAVEAWREPRFRPGPMRVVLPASWATACQTDLVLDGDEVADDLGRAPLARRDRRARPREPWRPRRADREMRRTSRANSVRWLMRHWLARRPGSGPASARPRRAGRPCAPRSRPADRDRSGRPRSSGWPGSTGSSRRPPRPATSRTIRSAGCRRATRASSSSKASPSRCGPGRPGSPGRAGCPGSARRSGPCCRAPRRVRTPTARAAHAGGAARRMPRPGGRRAPSRGSPSSRRSPPRTQRRSRRGRSRS